MAMQMCKIEGGRMGTAREPHEVRGGQENLAVDMSQLPPTAEASVCAEGVDTMQDHHYP